MKRSSNTLTLEPPFPKSSLANLQEITIDPSLPADLRRVQYIQQIKNPYCFLCGDTPVQLIFANHQTELSTLLFQYFSSLK